MGQVDEMATSTKSTLEVEESPPAKKPRTDSGDEVVADAEAASLAPPGRTLTCHRAVGQ